MEINKKIPKSEIAWVTYLNAKGDPAFIMTSKPTREYYYLYEILNDGSLFKLGRARSPTELEEKFCTKEN